MLALFRNLNEMPAGMLIIEGENGLQVSKNEGLQALEVININVCEKKIFHFGAWSTMHIAMMKDSYLYINILPVRYWTSGELIPFH